MFGKSIKTLVLMVLLLVTEDIAAQDSTMQWSCRRGTPRTESNELLRRSTPDGQIKQVGGDFYHGERHQLTVLVAFNDRSFKEDETATLNQWNKIFNVHNLSEAPFNGSVHDYFYAQSYGNFNLIFDLQYVQVKGDASKYASTDIDDENSQYLIADIMEELAQRDIDWSLYDWNGDGFVNQLLIICAGHGMNDTSGTDLIWPHQWWMSDHQKDRQEGVYCNPITVNYGDREYKVDAYCALAELTKNDDYGTFGTICHEYTHCFGICDFYYGWTSYIGAWELMDSGNYNGDGYCPASYSAHERWLMGWLTPIELTNDTTISNIPALSDAPQAFLIRNDGSENEYYIVENRQNTGWDAHLPSNGVIVFHIDYNAPLWLSLTESANNYNRQHYIIIPANNNKTLRKCREWAYPYKENNQLSNTSTPAAILWNDNTDGTRLMNKSLTDISVTNGLASFNFSQTTTAMKPIITDAIGKSTILYRFGPIYIIRNEQGQVLKIIK